MEISEATPLQQLELYAQREIGRQVAVLEFIQRNRELLEKAQHRPCLWSNYIDYDGLTRPQVLHLLKTFGGKWDKEPAYEGGQLMYRRRDQINGRTVRISGEPPSTCKIIETIKWVKTPAKKERVVTRKVVCK